MEVDKKIIEKKCGEVNRKNKASDRKVNQLLAVKDIGEAIASDYKLEELLALILNNLTTLCRIDGVFIMLVNKDKGCLEYLYGVGFHDENPESVSNYTVPLDCLSNILARVAGTGLTEYVPEMNSSFSRKEDIMSTHVKSRAVCAVPLIIRSKVIGILAADAAYDVGFPKETRGILEAFSPQIAIAIENARQSSRLQEQMEELKKSNALLSRVEKFSFLGHLAARLAHEIKNSMTAIGTFIQMLPRKFSDEEFRNNFHKVAMEATTRVNNLITELLDLVKTRKSCFELNDLHDLIEKMILLISPQSNEKGIRMIRQFDPYIPYIFFDAEKMKQVILNILSNAVESTPEGGKIYVLTSNGAAEGKSGLVSIEIRDNGTGMPSSVINKIFDPYFTTKNENSMHSGTGLGLFIARKNMEDHKGSIEVESKLDEGTKFTLTLPVHHSPFLDHDADEIDEN